MKAVVLVSAIAEWNAVKEILAPQTLSDTPYGESFRATLSDLDVLFFHAGWGKTASAGGMQYVLDHYAPDLTINLGTCGGFESQAELDEIILVERTFIYDIVELMGEFDSASTYYASNLDLDWLPDPLPHPARRGILASADSDILPEKISLLKEQGAIAADWESASLAWVAQKNGARLLILRAVSDLVGEGGSDAYDNIQVFRERTKGIMQRLIEQLPGWVHAFAAQAG